MKVKRIVADIGVSDPAAAKRFYQDILGLDMYSQRPKLRIGWYLQLQNSRPCCTF